MDTLTTCLWFDTQAEEAAAFYCSVFDGTITGTTRYPEGSMGEAGSVMTVDFEIAGMRLTALNGGPHFTFDEAISLTVPCDGQEEMDHYWYALQEGGGSESQCGWLKDRFGLSWQIYDPGAMDRMLNGDAAGAQRAMQAMYQMKRLDLAAMERAYAGE